MWLKCRCSSSNEFRSDFKHTPWTGTKQENPSVKQCWFVGAHSNIGGGYSDNHLNKIPRYWIQNLANQNGLEFYRMLVPPEHSILEPVIDSYSNFLFGVYKKIKNKYIRSPILGNNTLQDLHSSVYDYVFANNSYQPKNISSKYLNRPKKKEKENVGNHGSK